jgi:threonine/homoserine/homoserine lactone efflux protein
VLTYLVMGATYGFAAGAQPGQLQAYLISRTLAHGWRRTLPGALAPIFSDAPIICVVLVVLVRVPPLFVHLLQTVGGLFLIYLAWGALATYRDGAVTGDASAGKTLLRAVLLNLLNPNPYLAWMFVLGPILIDAWRRHPANGVALVAAFYFTMVLVTGLLVVLFSTARALGPRVSRALVGLSALALACFGVYQLWSGSTALIGRRGGVLP